MSLMDGLLRDNLLQTVLLQDVYIARRTDGAGRSTPIGSGTVDDPWDGSTQVFFDYILKNLVRAGQTINLGPTQTTSGDQPFQTKGVAEWSPKSGMRITGGGMGVTTLKLVSVPAGTAGYAVGMDLDGVAELSGFELSEMTIDCGFTGSEQVAAAVKVKGSHIRIEKIRVVNYGAASSSTKFGVVIGGGNASEDCVIQNCVVEEPHASNQGIAYLFQFYNSASPISHRFCVIRNNVGRGAAGYSPIPTPNAKVIGINPGKGVGTIIEGNEFANASVGIGNTPAVNTLATDDLVVWNNYFRNCSRGVYLDSATGSTGRVIINDNVIEISRAVMSPAPTGILLTGDSGGVSRFGQVIVRKNVIRDVDTPTTPTSGLVGVDLSKFSNAIIENNVITNIPSNDGVRYSNGGVSGYIKTFNNQTIAGQLIRAYDISTQKPLIELEDEVQDSFLSL